MDQPTPPKPIPARPPDSAAAPPPSPDRVEGTESTEVVFEHEGSTWRVRVLGRSGSATGRSPALLLLGFWDSQAHDAPHALEALVPGRGLDELSNERLAEALEQASPPRPSDRRPPFFEGLGQNRRGGSPQHDG